MLSESMLIEFFDKLKESKWLPWLGTAPFILGPFVIMFNGDVSGGLGLLAFLASMLVGLVLGGKLAQVFSTRIVKVSEDVEIRLTAAGCIFGFWFLPVLVVMFTNPDLGTEIGLHSITSHFFVACFGAGVAFCVTPGSSKVDN